MSSVRELKILEVDTHHWTLINSATVILSHKGRLLLITGLPIDFAAKPCIGLDTGYFIRSTLVALCWTSLPSEQIEFFIP